MPYIKILALVCFLIVMPVSAQAQGHNAFCDQADSSAATQACLKKHLQSAQKRLNAIYKRLGEKLDPEKQEEMKELQKSWLAYRDGECMWESENSVTPSMKRLNELSCMARVTEDRADILDVVYAEGQQEGGLKEYSGFPRWMNVVAKDHPDVFWNYGKRTAYDLNCDGEEEQIMQGVLTELTKITGEGETEGNQKLFSTQAVLAVVQNQTIGRPTATILEFPVEKEPQTNAVCTDKMSLHFKQNPAKEKTDEQEEPMECGAYIEINTKGCEPIKIVSTGKGFAVDIEEVTETDKKKPE